ncbi:site-specific integrase [Bacteroides sp. 51]|uniref:tyrosine-type recombinase/integrase n=1 Tax=Bacteroides sp. 51 TaxID=2302938 RepID=UPI0013D292BB|nr:site-specific integrase [Bacteroides sp. 51]NDV80706.1 hypothetical protein [Bacteroides sp. 51]
MSFTFKFHFRPSSKGMDVEGKLFIRIICKRQYKNLSTTYSVFPTEWNAALGKVVLPSTGTPRSAHLSHIDACMREDLSRLRMIVSLFETRAEYTVDDVLCAFKGSPENDDLLSYTEHVSNQLSAEGRQRTARAYRSATKSLISFNGGKPLCIGDISASLLNAYQESLIARGLFLNTVSFYMRNIRAIYNRSIRDGIISSRGDKPFEKVYTGVSPTVKRALSKEEMNKLADLELVLTNRLENYKKSIDEMGASPVSLNSRLSLERRYGYTVHLHEALMYFMFCFHARGMSYVDLAYLRKNEIRENKIIYTRKKSRQQLQVKITGSMQRILDYFMEKDTGSPYVFPIVDPRRGSERLQYESGLRVQNNRLHALGCMAELKKKVTTHVSRHSWATIAKYEMVSIPMISEALGHTNVKTTITYLDSFEDSRMDLLSDKISSVIKKKVA